MRQRNIKNLEEKLRNNSEFLIENPKELKGKWAAIFENENPIYLEIGCGKGQFIMAHATSHNDANYIAIEGQSNVALRALEKVKTAHQTNLRIFIDYIDDLREYFEAGELSGIYLNFSDPWPKDRHAKRRLTYGNRLLNYKEVLKEGGAIEFKSDNDGLFQFTLEEIERTNFEILEQTADLHDSSYESKECTTEYEDKFRASGKNINYVKFR